MTRMKDDRYYAGLVLKEVNKLLDFASRVDFSDPERNQEAIYAMNFCIVQIRENIANLSADFQKNKLGFRAEQFADFRNLLVHDYGDTDYAAYEHLVNVDMRKLKNHLEEFLGL